MKISGLQKLTLLDFPGLTACTVFTPGCNFRCPFCHNSELIGGGESQFSESDIIDYLSSRKGKIDGVCITGGEPLLQSGIEDFMFAVKKNGFKVKLDTNGSFPKELESAVNKGLCDYVAMDIKNSPEDYYKSAGIKVDTEKIRKSVRFLMLGRVDYEFRTTVVKGLNTEENMKETAKFIAGAKRYFLQQFKDSGHILKNGLTACSTEEMKRLLQTARENGVPNAELRGVE